MAANIVFLRRDDSSEPRGVAAPPPRPSCNTWTTLLEPSHSFAPHDDSTSSSWEPRSFAEDACNLLCGGSWPPRSYSCSFCKREFKSAQALGGHMNVHRRDRARLRERSSSTSDPASLALAPDLLQSDISHATDRPSVTFAYPAPNDSASSSSLWPSPPSSKPSFISTPVASASSVSIHQESLEALPRDGSNLPGFASGKRHGVSTSLLQLKSESSRKKAVTSGGFQPYHTVSVKNIASVHLPRLRSEDKENDNVAQDDLDLELRLGQNS